MDNIYITSFIRHILSIGGGILVTKGLADAGTADAVMGALATIVSFGWSVAEKKMLKSTSK